MKRCSAAKKYGNDFKIVGLAGLGIVVLLLSGTGASAAPLKNFPIGNKVAQARDITVTGTVTSETGAPLAGASISVKGRNGTSTNASGQYSITVPDNAVLSISYVGYETQTVSVNGRTAVDVMLRSSAVTGEGVVVIGYGVANRRDLTGSIVKIAGSVVADKPNSNPIASLQGRVAGLSVVNNGTPGGAPDIRLRGTSSLGQVHPLYVVDGIFNDNIDYLNPNDIESIEILKDPSSLAIFGVKGATGVIAITTKRAKAGQFSINLNTSYGFKKLVDKIKLVEASQFRELFAEENAADGNPNPDYSALTSNTDWIDAVTQTGNFSNTNLSLTSATDKNSFRLGIGYIYDEGIIKHQKLEKMTLSMGDEVKLNSHIKVGITLNVSRQNNPYDAGSVLDDARKVIPFFSADTKEFTVADPYTGDSIRQNIYSGLATALQTSGVVNPLLRIQNTYNKTISLEYRTVGSAYVEVNFLKAFTFRSTFYADMSNVNARGYTPLYYAYDPISNTPYLASDKTSVYENDLTYRKFQQDHILTYKKSFGDHSLTATGGFTTYFSSYRGRFANARPYTTGNALPIPDDKRFWYITSGFNDPTFTTASSGQNEYATTSLLARAMYNYKGKYFLNGSFRDDGSSRILGSNQHQKFWAAGAAWDITKEDFMANVKKIDYLKLKASIGVLGNQSAATQDGGNLDYPFYPNLNTGIAAVFGTASYNASNAAYQPNSDLQWETIHAKEVGIELNAFNNRLHFEGNYFIRTTKELSIYVTREDRGNNIDAILENNGSIRNRGTELSANWNQNFAKDFSVSVGGNITFINNKVLSIAPEFRKGYFSRTSQNNGTAESRTTPGYAIGSFYGYVVEGLFQTYNDVLSSPSQAALGSYGPGDFKFKDVNGDGKITSDDRTVIGNPTPKFSYGGNINLNYKGFSLGIDFNGVYGNQVFRTWGSLESPFQRVNYSAEKLSRWHGEGTSNWTPILSQGHRINYNGSTYNIEDGSYFRLRNIQLGYSFGKTMIAKARMKDLRVFANVQNAKTWKNNLGYTAEYGGDATSFGYDYGGGAIPVITTFGLNVTF